MAATLLLHESIELPEPAEMLVEERLHDRLVELVVTAKLTVPVKPLTGATLVVEVPAMLVFTVTLVGLAPIVKSTI